MTGTRPIALSIAGFDPSGGAGLLADSKTFEANAVYGLGVVSALTWQNDIAFEKVEWIPPEKIGQQLRVLQARFSLRYVKIGLVENAGVLLQLTRWIREHAPGAVIVWDPVLKASAGFSFHDRIAPALLEEILQQVDCITPNLPEAQQLFGAHQLQERLLEQDRRGHLPQRRPWRRCAGMHRYTVLPARQLPVFQPAPAKRRKARQRLCAVGRADGKAGIGQRHQGGGPGGQCLYTPFPVQQRQPAGLSLFKYLLCKR